MKRLILPVLILTMTAFLFTGCAATVNSVKDVERFQQMAAQGDEGAITALMGALKSGDRAKRDAAYTALVNAGEPAMPRLIAALGDKDLVMMEYAAGILGNIGDKRATSPLLELLKSDRPRRYIAAWALGKMKATEAVEPLIGALAVKNEALQKESTRALIELAEASVPALTAALESRDSDVRKYSCRALGVIEAKGAEDPLIKRLGDNDKDVAAAAALALGTAGTQKAIPHLIEALKSEYVITKVNASISLGTLGAKEAVDPLTAMMDSDDDPQVREWSARALENITGNRYKYRDENGVMMYPYNLYR